MVKSHGAPTWWIHNSHAGQCILNVVICIANWICAAVVWKCNWKHECVDHYKRKKKTKNKRDAKLLPLRKNMQSVMRFLQFRFIACDFVWGAKIPSVSTTIEILMQSLPVILMVYSSLKTHNYCLPLGIAAAVAAGAEVFLRNWVNYENTCFPCMLLFNSSKSFRLCTHSTHTHLLTMHLPLYFKHLLVFFFVRNLLVFSFSRFLVFSRSFWPLFPLFFLSRFELQWLFELQ